MSTNNCKKKLLSWVTNNWRPYQNQKRAEAPLKVTLRDVVRKTKKDEIHEEVKILLGDDVDPAAPEYLGPRSKALSTVMDRLSTEDRKELLQVVDEWSNQGYPEEHRRR